jgi:hypothetical protein
MLTKCPSCNSVEVESMPLCDKELYKFDYHPPDIQTGWAFNN